MKTVRWIFFKIGGLALIIYAGYAGAAWAGRIVRLIAWLSVVSGFGVALIDEMKAQVAGVTEIALVLCLVGCGWWVTGLFYAIAAAAAWGVRYPETLEPEGAE